MYLSLTSWLEIGVLLVIALPILWAKPEWGLFLYGLALGFPDAAFPLGTAINVRLDDALIFIYLVRVMLWAPVPPSPKQGGILSWQALFLAACLLSVVVETMRGTPPPAYEAAKMAGCAVIVFVLPRLVQSERRLRSLIFGLICGGLALAVQVFYRLGTSSVIGSESFQELKNAATFSTWNPNTTGQAAVLLVLAASLGGIMISKTPVSRLRWFFLATGFALMPAFLFVRGTTLAIAAGFLLFCCLHGRWKSALLFAAVCLAALSYFRSSGQPLLEDATTVNPATGEGFSHRFERWDLAFRAIQKQPLLGQGFGQEWNYLSLLGSEGRAHNAYLTVWLELGLLGLALFLAAIFQFVSAGLRLYKNPECRSHGALILALMMALGFDSLGLSTLYWEKLPTIALSLAVAVIGLCERSAFATTEAEAQILTYEPFPQHL